MDDGTKVADFVIDELNSFPFSNPTLDKIFTTYQEWYFAGVEPTEKSFLYYPDQEMSTMVISLLEFPYQLSPGWDKMADAKKIEPEKAGKMDVKRSVQYYKLRKLKEMLKENQKELQQTTDGLTLNSLLEVHMELKKIEMGITKEMGTVILH
jgi:DNA primase